MFTLDAEAAHEVAMKFLQRGVLKSRLYSNPALEQSLFGVRFPNPLGLAAGFDKNALVLNHWHQLGFGFAEIGTVTFHAQPGNEKPRMFRLQADNGLINRLGFNNDGAQRIATRLAEGRPQIPIGVNLGKSRVAELDAAADDYRNSYRILSPFGDYFVVNVSSPNTPGLRDLQEKGRLLEIVAALREVNPARPLFVKVSPDLETPELEDVIQVAHEAKLTGLIATNTTIEHSGLTPAEPHIDEEGGVSGRPLKEMSNRILAHLYKSCDRDMILMGVGGIENGEDLYQKIALGAHLAQVYTGWIYGGPHMAPDTLERLGSLMALNGFDSIASLRGSAAQA